MCNANCCDAHRCCCPAAGVWGTWTKSITAHALIPHGLVLELGLCQLSTGKCKGDLFHDNGGDDAITRKGLHAYDHSVTQLFFSYQGTNVSVETSQIAGPHSDFVARVSLVETHERLLALPGFSGPRGSGAACRRYSHDEHVRARARKHGIITPFRSNPIYQTVPEKSVRIMRSTGVGATRGDEPDAHRACQRRRRQLALDPLPRAGLLSHVLCVLLACVCKPSVPQCLRTV